MPPAEVPRTRARHLRRGRPSSPAAAARLGPRAAALSVLLAGLSVTVVLFITLRARDLDSRRLGFERDAQRLATAVQGHFQLPLELVHSVSTLFTASESVTRREFQSFTREILAAHPSVYAFEWMPLVADDERAALEAAAQADGVDGFCITQKDATGRIVTAGRRPEYMPILFMQPVERLALGLDAIANPERTTAPQRARAEGRPVVSDRYSLIEDPPDVVSVVVYAPTHGPAASDEEGDRGVFLGLVAILLRIQPVVERAVEVAGEEFLRVTLVDTAAPAGKRLLYGDATDEAAMFDAPAGDALAGDAPAGDAPVGDAPVGHSTEFEADRPALDWMSTFQFADRRYRVHLEPTPGSPWEPGRAPWITLLVGAVVSSLMSGAAAATHVIRGLRRQVDDARQLGQYTLARELGRGGMGRVYEARHRLLARPAAIKLIDPLQTPAGDGDAARLESTLDRFEREAQATASLCSPHTIRIYDFGRTDDGAFYYVMELLDGIDLERLVEVHGPLAPERAVFILRQVCHSLAEAHAAGMVHRDIKPANVFVCRHGLEHDFVKVLDFGLVRGRQHDEAPDVMRTGRGVVLGTPAYMAPEAALDGPGVDRRADLYSLGCVGYYLLTGTPVFAGATAIAVLAHHASTPVEPPSRRAGRAISDALEQTILACLAKSPAGRPSSAVELDRRLAACPEDGGWSWEDARRWWDAHGDRPRSDGDGAAPAPAPTVRIDTGTRGDRERREPPA